MLFLQIGPLSLPSLVIGGFSGPDFVIGLAAAVIAAVASVRLSPCSSFQFDLRACVGMFLRLFLQSLAAGMDVARRALHPDLPIRPGFIQCTSELPEGAARSAFTVLVSMQPGSVPIPARQKWRFMVHCLDDTLPVGAALDADEARLRRGVWLGPRSMADFFFMAAALVVADNGRWAFSRASGTHDADRMMAAQLLGTGGVAALLLAGVRGAQGAMTSRS